MKATEHIPDFLNDSRNDSQNEARNEARTEAHTEALHTAADSLFRQSLEACSIQSAFDRRIAFQDGKLLRLTPSQSGPPQLALKDYKRVFLIAMGKAAGPMLETLLARMPRRKGLRGICCSNALPERRNWRIRYFCGGHPLPSEGSFSAARAALALLRKARKDTLVIFLISGGASALFDLPLDPEISLEDAMGFHQALIGSGAPITEINILRKHFSAVKGGRLAIAAGEAAKLSILLPDVPLRSLDTLASGPTLPDPSTAEDVEALLDRYSLLGKFPARVADFFRQTLHPDPAESAEDKGRLAPFLPRLPRLPILAARGETRTEGPAGARHPAPRAGNATDADGNPGANRAANAAANRAANAAFRDAMYEVLLSSHDLVENARTLAEKAGYHTVVDNSCDDWDYADAARYLLQKFHALRALHPRCCLISGGEVTVTLSRNPGAGGRNQQFALACAVELAAYAGAPLVVLSAGSDGIDGNTRAAGAIADTSTVRRAVAFGYDPAQALAAFNACPLFTALGDSVVTGPTGHNLRDLRLLLSDDPDAAAAAPAHAD